MMKSFFYGIFIILFCITTFIFDGRSVNSSEKKHRAIVVYYSRDGHTKQVAEKLARKFGADIEPLIDKKNRKGILGNTSAGKDAVMKLNTIIEPLKHNLDNYDTVFIGTPAWFSNMAPAVRTFINQNDLTNKTVAYFATCHRVGADKAAAQMYALVNSNVHTFKMLMPLNHEDIKNQLDKKIDGLYLQFISMDKPK